jgi:tetratricopeptide (TPR) repeat protein
MVLNALLTPGGKPTRVETLTVLQNIYMENSATRLDADELLHLALDASNKDNPESAITYLKRALDLEPADARVHYLLGAEHAQIGMYDKAAEEMAHAVSLNPQLYTAHFQLGLLHLTSGRTEEALHAWTALDALDENNFLFIFKCGLSHLIRDEFQACIECLERGIAANTVNPALNNDMLRVISEVRVRIAALPAAGHEIGSSATDIGHHVFISAYTNTKN